MQTHGKTSGNGQADTVSGTAVSQHTGKAVSQDMSAPSAGADTRNRTAEAANRQMNGNGREKAEAVRSGRSTAGNTAMQTKGAAAHASAGSGEQRSIVDGKSQPENGSGPEQKGTEAASVPAAEDTSATGSDGETVGTEQHAAEPFDLVLPVGMPVNSAMLDAYREFCMESGFTQEQAQKAVDFYLNQQSQGLAAERESSLELLRTTLWGGRFEEKIARANHAVHALNQRMEGRLLPVVEAGLGNNAAFVELMSLVGESISEDSFAANSGAPVGAPAPMSTEDFLRYEVFNK